MKTWVRRKTISTTNCMEKISNFEAIRNLSRLDIVFRDFFFDFLLLFWHSGTPRCYGMSDERVDLLKFDQNMRRDSVGKFIKPTKCLWACFIDYQRAVLRWFFECKVKPHIESLNFSFPLLLLACCTYCIIRCLLLKQVFSLISSSSEIKFRAKNAKSTQTRVVSSSFSFSHFFLIAISWFSSWLSCVRVQTLCRKSRELA